MSKKSKKLCIALLNRTLLISGVFIYGCFLVSGRTTNRNSINNIDSVKSIQAVHMVTKYDHTKQLLLPTHVNNMEEARELGPIKPISFTGQMTAYNAVCKGCTGRVACPPGQDVRNGNIWYNDQVYGNVRILAADRNIPCGTIVKITNVTFSDSEILGIVLDRGGAIKGNIMDFLMAEDDDMDIVGRQFDVNYEVVRWGW